MTVRRRWGELMNWLIVSQRALRMLGGRTWLLHYIRNWKWVLDTDLRRLLGAEVQGEIPSVKTNYIKAAGTERCLRGANLSLMLYWHSCLAIFPFWPRLKPNTALSYQHLLIISLTWYYNRFSSFCWEQSGVCGVCHGQDEALWRTLYRQIQESEMTLPRRATVSFYAFQGV